MQRRSYLRVAAVSGAMALALAAGCRTPANPDLVLTPYVLEDFEFDRLWSLDSANNYGSLQFDDKDVTSGNLALVLSFNDNGRGNTMFRREVDYDLSETSQMLLDIYNHCAEPGVAVALAFKTEDGGYYETAAAPLPPGWNRSVVFGLTDGGMKRGTHMPSWMAKRNRVTRLMILVFPGANAQGRITVDNLRTDQPARNRSVPPELVISTLVPDVVEQFEVCEIEIVFRTPLSHSLERRQNGVQGCEWEDLDVQAVLRGPDGDERVLHGFMKAAEDHPAGNVTYGLRFCPDRAGRWHVDVGYRSCRRWFNVDIKDFSCRASSRPAPVGVDRLHPAYFRDARDKRFFPLGQNVCWAGDYEPYLNAIDAYGGNLMRVWICPWNNALLAENNVRAFRLDNARNVDRILEGALRRGIYVQLVLAYHGWFGADWHRNPFNAANGGPCALPQDFWFDEAARQAFRHYVHYAVRRWSAYPNLFAWELVNEADLAPAYDARHVVDWHDVMSAYLHRADPHRHMVTSSLSGEAGPGGLFDLPFIDFSTSHIYTPDIVQALNRAFVVSSALAKPHFVAEIGRGWFAGDDQVDRGGVHLHHSLWLSWMLPWAGSCLPWWWDTHIEANHLYQHFAALSVYDHGEDRHARHFQSWTGSLPAGNGSGPVQVQGLLGDGDVFGFVYNADALARPGAAWRGPLLKSGRSLAVKGLRDGPYTFEVWDTYTGKVSHSRRLNATGGELVVELPPAEKDFAFKLKSLTRPAMRIELQ